MGNDTIIIKGGRVEAIIDFKWLKKEVGDTIGTGNALCLSN